MTRPALLWFRRDLRLADHPALDAARAGRRDVLGVFVLDPVLWRGAGPARRTFLAGALADLSRRTGGRLAVLHGEPATVLPAAARHVGAGAVHVSADYTPYGTARDEQVRAALARDGIGWAATGGPYAVEPGHLRTGAGAGYRRFAAYRRSWLAHGWPEPVRPRPGDWLSYDGPHRGGLPQGSWAGDPLPEPTEQAALARWREFRDRALPGYAEGRDRPDLDGTSGMSAYLHLGLVHPRTLLAGLGEGEGARRFRTELCWREFYADVLLAEPGSAWTTHDPGMRGVPVDTGPGAREVFEAWQDGRTGFPLVDAGMRQLAATGWMHNRVRMVTASFLVKDLHLPWQWGARHFLRHLVDGDLASNNHGWQWVAGSGPDAAPYFRVFNPARQGAAFDPDGRYVHRWVPELAGLPAAQVHAPGAHRPTGYPPPLVDHAAQRAEALLRYRSTRPGGGAKAGPQRGSPRG